MESKSERLVLSRPFWVAMSIVAMLGIFQRADRAAKPDTLDYLDGDRPPIIRMRRQVHRFDALGIEVTPPRGWIYLSRQDTATADQVTFVCIAAGTIVQIERYAYAEWPPVERELRPGRYAGVEIVWIDVDHRRLGRLTGESSDLAVKTYSMHANGASTAVKGLCDAIRFPSR